MTDAELEPLCGLATKDDEQRLEKKKRRFKDLPFDIHPRESTRSPIRIVWFNDRVVIQSPGGPFGQVNRSNFGRPGVVDCRNANLAGVTRDLAYVQRFGDGIGIATQAMKENGSPPSEFDVDDSFVHVTPRRRPPAIRTK